MADHLLSPEVLNDSASAAYERGRADERAAVAAKARLYAMALSTSTGGRRVTDALDFTRGVLRDLADAIETGDTDARR